MDFVAVCMVDDLKERNLTPNRKKILIERFYRSFRYPLKDYQPKPAEIIKAKRVIIRSVVIKPVW